MSDGDVSTVRAIRAKRQRVVEVSADFPTELKLGAGKSAKEEQDEVAISEYELQRLERIKRNNAFIAALSVKSLEKVCAFRLILLVQMHLPPKALRSIIPPPQTDASSKFKKVARIRVPP